MPEPDPPPPPKVDPGYALGQLARALVSGGERAAERVRQWTQVLTGLASGALRVGGRTPVADVPPWVTLEVAHGGFATGSLAAGGRLLPHEVADLARVPRPPGATERAALNLHFLGDAGRAELAAALADGRYRVGVPEEGALLAVTWLLGRGERERAASVVDALLPLTDRLRFYPFPHPRPPREGPGVAVEPAGATAARLRAKRARPAVARQREAARVWAPLADEVVALLLETVEGEPPRLRTDAAGALVRAASGQPVVEGGWPCRRYPPGWAARARAHLEAVRAARAAHGLCGKPDRPKENAARLRAHLATAAADPAGLTGRAVGEVRRSLAAHVTRHGLPGSERRAAGRAAALRSVAGPLHHPVAAVLAERLAAHDPDEGVADLGPVLAPLTPDEAARAGAAPGAPLPAALAARARRCLEAPLATLVAEGLVPSSERLARLLPAVVARTCAAAVEDPALRRLVAAVYVAFRRRRSLLLLDHQSQVRLRELPWVAAVEPWTGGDDAARAAAWTTLVETASVALAAFPGALLPNPLVRELRALGAAAGVRLALPEELAADIFMGTFTGHFLEAARVAARLLDGSLYARYYDLPAARVLAFPDPAPAAGAPRIAEGFSALARERAGPSPPRGRSVAWNGAVLEQAQVLTTHGLASLVSGLDLLPALRPRLPDLARRAFVHACARVARPRRDRRAGLHAVKDAAYAWRNLTFFLALAGPAEVDAFLPWAEARLARDGPPDLRPALAGLRAVAEGGAFDAEGRHPASGGRRLLGWVVGTHWLLDGAPA